MKLRLVSKDEDTLGVYLRFMFCSDNEVEPTTHNIVQQLLDIPCVGGDIYEYVWAKNATR